jgi:hypothetical protein
MIPAVLAGFAFMTSFLFSFWCESIKFTSVNPTPDVPDILGGVWYRQDTVYEEVNGRIFIRDVCVDYPSGTEIDSKWKTVRAFSIIAPVLGGLLTVILILAPCLYFLDEMTWRSIAIQFIVVITIFQGLTFLIFQSSACTEQQIVQVSGLYNEECEWEAGSTTNVFSIALWFLTGLVMLKIGAPKRPEIPPAETQAVTYQQTMNPDGGTTVAEVAVVKGTAVPKEEPLTSKVAEP